MPRRQHEHRHLHGRRALADAVDRWVDDMITLESRDGGDNGNGGSSQPNSGGRDAATLVRTIYKTMEPTFTGPIAGYSTLLQDTSPSPSTAPQQGPPPAPSPTPEPKAASSNQPAPAPDAPTDLSSLPSAIPMPTQTAPLGSVLVLATAQPSALPTPALGNTPPLPSSTSAVPSASSTTDLSTGDKANAAADEGTSAGAKAGIAFSALGAALLFGLLIFLLVNRHRKAAAQRQSLQDDEKLDGAAAAGAAPLGPVTAARTGPKAPRISLRPVTQFLPNWNGFDKRTSKGAGMALAGAPTRPAGGSAWERPGTSQSANPANPFGNQAERAQSPLSEVQSSRSLGTPSPSAANDKTHAPETAPPPKMGDPLTANGPPIAAAAAAGTAAAAAAAASGAGLVRKTSMRNGGPKNVDLTLPLPPSNHMALPSPAGTEFSMSSLSPGTTPPPSNGAAAIAAAGGPQNAGVHRVQLDFQPTLEDEMGLTAGELVRLLHEYDDGWALVIRLDRSQQGVVPRTCLSTRPVKPRPPPGAARAGPPVKPSGRPGGGSVGNGQRPTTPQGMTRAGWPVGPPSPSSGALMGPPGPRPASPGMHGARPRSPMGRPASPAGGSHSPGPRRDAFPGSVQSPGGANGRMAPPGPSPMTPQPPHPGSPSRREAQLVGRKPVPGQAY